MIEIKKIEPKYAGCVSCHSHDSKDMYAIRFAGEDWSGIVIDLCQDCIVDLKDKITDVISAEGG